MAATLRPRRGKVADFPNLLLKEGELLLDITNIERATILNSWGRVFVGNGSANVGALKPFIASPQEMIINNGINTSGEDGEIKNGKSLSELFNITKKKLINMNVSTMSETFYGKYGSKIIASKSGLACTLYFQMPTSINVKVQPYSELLLASLDRNVFKNYIPSFSNSTTNTNTMKFPVSIIAVGSQLPLDSAMIATLKIAFNSDYVNFYISNDSNKNTYQSLKPSNITVTYVVE